MLTLGPLAFLAPWLLTAFLALPVLWWLLRIMPPAPRVISFPAIRLLYRLQAREETPDTAPWWLLLLRLLLAALLILALAHPVLNPGPTVPGSGPVVLVIDDGWSTGRDWSRRQDHAVKLLEELRRAGRPVALVSTAAAPFDGGPATKPVEAADAAEIVKALVPRPWPSRPAELIDALPGAGLPAAADVVWIVDGLDDEGDAALAQSLQRLGSLSVLDIDTVGPATLSPPANTGRVLEIPVARMLPGVDRELVIRAQAADGRVLGLADAVIPAGETGTTVELSLPIELRNEIARLEIEGESTAGGVVLLDDRFQRRSIGLVSATGFQGAQPLLDELYYLERATAPFAEVSRGSVAELVEADPSTLILPDVGALPLAEREAVGAWVEAGGVLIRFAGPRLAGASADVSGLAEDQLVPTRLRSGDRILGGALTWAAPVRIAGFAESSPFADIREYADVVVRRQVLAEPSIDLGQRTWARLTDGTPMVTANRRGDGWIVLFHVTANTAWSNLPISGLFVEMLQRVAALGVEAPGAAVEEALPPMRLLDGFGRLAPPQASARPLQPASEGGVVIGPANPPGYYGNDLARRAVNLAPGLAPLAPFDDLPSGTVRRGTEAESEVDLKAALLAAAALLLLVDGIVTLVLRGLIPVPWRAAGMAIVLTAALSVGTDPAAAQQADAATGDDAFALSATLDTRLAYIRTGQSDVDAVTHSGLSSLGAVLTRRTAVEPAEPMGVDPSVDELAFFPLIYWPVTAGQATLSDQAVRRLNAYMRNGGTIVFDTRDQFESSMGGGAGSGLARLREISGRLEIPPLAPVAEGHVLTKSFYLLNDFPGRFTGGRVWIAESRSDGASEVTPVIIGAHDWIGAWARTETGQPAFPAVPGGELQREMAYRFGVNLVMYALTGNYKADQVHIPAILERLGQ